MQSWRQIYDTKAIRYIKELITIRNSFPNIRLITPLGYLHPKHVAEAIPAVIFKLISFLSLNGANL